MDTRTLSHFLTLSECLHFARASEICHLSPSALSRSIKALEDSLGVQLFLRDKRSVSLTPEGQLFQKYARTALNDWHTVKENLLDQQSKLVGELKVFCSVTASYSFLYEILQGFRQEHQGVEIKLNTGDPAQGIARIRSEQEDIAIAACPKNLPTGIQFKKIQTTPLVAISRNDDGRERGIDGDFNWQKTPMILSMEGLARETSDAWFREMQIKPKIYAQVAGNEAIVSMVALGFGTGIVPEIVLENSPLREQVKKIPTPSPIGQFDVGVFALNKRLTHPILAAFWKTFVNQ
ncbi:HTH-type transcriptional activator IlvY [Sessilibacter sp. MAH4]